MVQQRQQASKMKTQTIISQFVAFGLLACLTAVLSNLKTAAGCERAKSYRRMGSGRMQLEIIENLSKCVRHMDKEYHKLPEACCALGICAKPESSRRVSSIQKQSVPEILFLVFKCVINLITQDRERYKALQCCRIIPWPWC